eukprot:UN29516
MWFIFLLYRFPYFFIECLNPSKSHTDIIESDSISSCSLYPTLAQPPTETPYDRQTIFVLIGSFRDPECAKTIISAFEQAIYPDRLRFGVYQQHRIEDIDCTDFTSIKCPDHILCGREWQIKIHRVDPLGGLGPMYGRYRGEAFYDGEDYVFQ